MVEGVVAKSLFFLELHQAAQFHNNSGVGENLGFADVRLGILCTGFRYSLHL